MLRKYSGNAVDLTLPFGVYILGRKSDNFCRSGKTRYMYELRKIASHQWHLSNRLHIVWATP